MAKSKKQNPIHFGIEVTKPHSVEMYAHNDKVANELKSNIIEKWEKLISELGEINMETPWSAFCSSFDITKLQKNVMYSGYGSGYTLEMVDKEFRKELEDMSNWQLHETYAYCCFDSLVPRTKQGMVGFDWEKMNYWTEQMEGWGIEPTIDIIKRIAGDNLRYSSHADVDGNVTKHPYIKVYNKSGGEEIVNKLLAYDIEAYVDLYEDEDGDDGYGRTIIRKAWSVKISNK